MKTVSLLTSTTAGAKLNICIVVGNKRVRTMRFDDIKTMQRVYTRLVGMFKESGVEVIYNEGMLLWS